MIPKIRSGMLLIITLLTPVVIPAGAQSESLPFAAITQNRLVLYGMSDTPTAIQLPGEYQHYGNLAWSPDGRSLVVAAADQYYHWQLIMIQPDEAQPTILLDEPPLDLPVSFTPDGYLLLTRETGAVADDPLHSPILEVYSTSGVSPIASLGRFAFGRACGGGSSLPVDWLYWAETNSGPSESPPILALTPSGIVHSTNCTGRGVALLDTATGTDTALHASLGWVNISPDGMKIAGMVKSFYNSDPRQLLLIDLSTQVITELTISANVGLDQVFWGTTNNDLFYTTTVTVARIPADDAGQQKLGEAFGYMNATTLPENAIELHHLDLATNIDTILYFGSAYALGRLVATPDGAGILFSSIPNVDRWLEALLAGEISLQEGDSGSNLLAVELYYLDMASGTVSLIGTDMAHFAFNSGAYTTH